MNREERISEARCKEKTNQLRTRQQKKEKRKAVLEEILAYTREHGKAPQGKTTLGRRCTWAWGTSPQKLLWALEEVQDVKKLLEEKA